MTSDSSFASGAHPLDPLTPGELRLAATVLAAGGLLVDSARLVVLELLEPTKGELEGHARGEQIDRRASAILRIAATRSTLEVVVSLTNEAIVASTERPEAQPSVTAGEIEACTALLRRDPTYLAALARRGVDDVDLVVIEAWGVGGFVAEEDEGRRLVWCPSWVRRTPHGNPYARPIEGVYAIVDLDRLEVLRVEDHGVIPVATEDGDYTPEALGELRTAPRPLEIIQPEGASFTLDGRQISWQGWSLRLGFTPREGLVLHQLAYDEGAGPRSILHRASFSELFVPYGDPGPGSYRRNAFDIGEYGVGWLTNSLELGCDCLGEITYLDAHLADDRGVPYTIKNAICLHEEDHGLLWKHTDTLTGDVESRRARRLVISFIATADNYEYAFYWHLYQDGLIECEVRLTGIVLTSGVEEDAETRWSQRLGPRLAAPNHQHFFNVRLDFDLDGRENTVYEVHAEPDGTSDDPHGNAFRGVATPIRTESDASHYVDALAGRFWRIASSRTNAVGEPTAYRLVPGANTGPMAQPGSSVRRRARFMDRHVWVTPYEPKERFASGDHPNLTNADTGLGLWAEQDRSVEATDVVVWYTFGTTHLARLEDWPVMPVERIGFTLKPDGFFDRNPAINLPRARSTDSRGHGPHCRAA